MRTVPSYHQQDIEMKNMIQFLAIVCVLTFFPQKGISQMGYPDFFEKKITIKPIPHPQQSFYCGVHFFSIILEDDFLVNCDDEEHLKEQDVCWAHKKTVLELAAHFCEMHTGTVCEVGALVGGDGYSADIEYSKKNGDCYGYIHGREYIVGCGVSPDFFSKFSPEEFYRFFRYVEIGGEWILPESFDCN